MFLTIGISMLFMHEIFAQPCIYSTVEISDIDGREIPFSSMFSMKGNFRLVILFSKLDDPPDDISLMEVMEQYKDSIDLQNTRVVLMVVDHNGCSLPVKAQLKGKAIEMEAYIDRNGSARREFGIGNTPQIIIFDAFGDVLWRQIYYPDFEPCLLYENIKSLKAKSKH
jgi:hypothetical protein